MAALIYIRTEPAYKVYEASLVATPKTLSFFTDIAEGDSTVEVEILEISPRKFRRGYKIKTVGTAIEIPIGTHHEIRIYRYDADADEPTDD